MVTPNYNLKEKVIETKNGKIFYYETKNQSVKPTVIFLHGLSANHTSWVDIMDIFSENGYRSIAPDLRGHGHSDKTKKRSLYKIAEFSKDLKQILEAENIKRIFLVGYSFGGTIAIDFSIKYPEVIDKLILISVNHVTPLKYWNIRFLNPAAKLFLDFLALLLFGRNRKQYYYYIHDQSERYWQSTWFGWKTMPLTVNAWMLRQILSIDYEKTIGRITAPTLIVGSKTDHFVSKKEITDMIKAIPNSQVIEAKHSSHFIATRAHKETAVIILKFLARNENSDF